MIRTYRVNGGADRSVAEARAAKLARSGRWAVRVEYAPMSRLYVIHYASIGA